MIGLLIPNPFIALIAGAACICVEILLLNVIAKGLDKLPPASSAAATTSVPL